LEPDLIAFTVDFREGGFLLVPEPDGGHLAPFSTVRTCSRITMSPSPTYASALDFSFALRANKFFLPRTKWAGTGMMSPGDWSGCQRGQRIWFRRRQWCPAEAWALFRLCPPAP
jgi:hypothetical protein